MGPEQLTAHLPVTAAEAVTGVDATGVGGAAQVVQGGGQIAVHRRPDEADGATPFVQIALHAHHAVVGERLDHIPVSNTIGVDDRRPLLRRHRIEQPDRPPVCRLPRQLGRADDRRVLWRVYVAAPGIGDSLRLPSDTPRVEQLFDTVAAAQTEVENVRSLEKERSFLLEERLKSRKVDHRGIGLDLAEVRIDGEVECEAVGQPVLDVGAQAAVEVTARLERVPVLRRRERLLRDYVRQDLQSPRRRDPLDSSEVAVFADPTRGVFGDRLPLHRLVFPLNHPLDVEPPNLLGRRREAQLRQRNSELGHPALFVHSGRHVPNRIPRVILAGVVEQVFISLDTRRVHPEFKRGSAVEIRVDAHRQPVGRRIQIASRELPDDLVGLAVVGADTDVKRPIIVEHSCLGALARGLPLVRIPLHEVGDRLRQRPDRLVQPPVELGCALGGSAGESPVRLFGPNFLVFVVVGRPGR